MSKRFASAAAINGLFAIWSFAIRMMPPGPESDYLWIHSPGPYAFPERPIMSVNRTPLPEPDLE